MTRIDGQNLNKKCILIMIEDYSRYDISNKKFNFFYLLAFFSFLFLRYVKLKF